MTMIKFKAGKVYKCLKNNSIVFISRVHLYKEGWTQASFFRMTDNNDELEGAFINKNWVEHEG